MNRSEMAIDNYLKHYRRINIDDLNEFLGNEPLCSWTTIIFRHIWESRGLETNNGSEKMYHAECPNIREISKAIHKVLNYDL